MKRLIYQVSLIDPLVGKPSKLYQWCIDSVKAYCEKYGIEHIVQTEPILKIGPLDWSKSNRSDDCKKRGYMPIYEKENAFNYLDDYDQVAVVDADIYIKPSAPNIFDEYTSDFAGVIERDMPITSQYLRKIIGYSYHQYHPLSDVDFKPNNRGHEFFNMGLMLMSSSIKKYIGGTPEEFIRRPEYKKLVDGIGHWKWSTDQTLLNHWVRKSGMTLQRLSWKWNALYKGVEDKHLKDAYFVHFFLKDKLPNRGENIEQLKKLVR